MVISNGDLSSGLLLCIWNHTKCNKGVFLSLFSCEFDNQLNPNCHMQVFVCKKICIGDNINFFFFTVFVPRAKSSGNPTKEGRIFVSAATGLIAYELLNKRTNTINYGFFSRVDMLNIQLQQTKNSWTFFLEWMSTQTNPNGEMLDAPLMYLTFFLNQHPKIYKVS